MFGKVYTNNLIIDSFKMDFIDSLLGQQKISEDNKVEEVVSQILTEN